MKKKDWNEGLNHLDPKLVEEYVAQKEAYAQKKKRTKPYWFSAVAAVLVLVVCIGMLAVGNGIPGVPTGPVQGSDPQIDPTHGPIATVPQLDPTCGADPQPITFTIFVPNEEGDGFLQLDATVEQLDPHLILPKLQDAGVIAQDAVVLTAVVDGNNMLTLDMNEAFLLQLCSLDSADESMLMSCLVNTFLSAFDYCECMMVTAEGDIIRTSHANYDSPMCGLKDSD